MGVAIELAREAARRGEVPVGAVVVHDQRVIGSGYNLRESLHDPTAHAEMIAIRSAASALGSWRLDDCQLYVTLEPCPMCAGAIVLARVPEVIYGAVDPKAGAHQTLFRLLDDPRLNHRSRVTPGLLSDQCSALLTEFFRELRGR